MQKTAVIGWLAVVLVSTTANALQLLSKRTPLAANGNQLDSYAIVGVRLQPQDLGTTASLTIQAGDGTMYNVEFDSELVVHLYDVLYIGVIPRDGMLLSSTAMFVRDVDAFFGVNATQIAENIDPAGRELLQVGGTPVCINQGSVCEIACRTQACRDDAAVTFYNSGFSAVNNVGGVQFDGAHAYQALCFAFYNNVHSAAYKNCAAGFSARKFQALDASLENMVSGIQNWTNKVTLYQQGLFNASSDLLTQQLRQQNLTNTFNKLLNGLQLENQRTDAQLNDTLAYATAVVTGQKNQLSATNRFLAAVSTNLSQAINATSLATYQAYLRIIQDYQQYTQTFEDGVDAYLKRRKVVLSQQLASQQLLVSQATALSELVSGVQLLRRHSVQIHRDIATLTSQPTGRGETLVPLLDTEDLRPPATDPSNLGPLYKSAPIGDMIIRTITTSGGLPYGMVTRIGWSCETVDFTTAAPRNPPFEMIVKMLGPPGCDTTFTDPYMPNRCTCAAQVTVDQRCLLQNTAGVVSANDIVRFRNATANDLSSNSSCLLQAQVVPGGMQGQYLTSVNDLASTFATISRRGRFSQTPDYQYQLYSLYLKQKVVEVPYADIVSNGTNFAMVMDNPNLGGGQNLVYAFMNLMVYSYGFAWRQMQIFRDVVWGVVPNHMDQHTVLWQNLTVGTSGHGSRFSAMMVSTATLAVSQLVPTTTIATVRVRINGVNVTVSDLTVDDLYTGLLPLTRGIVWNPPTAQYEFWDTRSKDVVISGSYPARLNSLTALAAYSPDLLKRKYIAYFARRDVEHERSAHVASGYRVELESDSNSPNYGRCTKLAAVPGGGWCTLFDHYRMTTFGTFDDHNVVGNMGFVSRDASIRFTFRVPDGQVFFISTSVCPVVTAAALLTSGTGTQVISIRNPIGAANSFRVQQIGACPSTTTLVLAPLQTTRLNKRGCAAAPDGQPDSLTFSYLDQATQTYRDCNTTLVLNRTFDAVSSIRTAATLNFTYFTEAVSSDVTITRSVQASLNLRVAQIYVMQQRARIIVSRNISLPDGAVDQVAQIVAQVRDLGNGIDDYINTIVQTKNDVTNALQNGTSGAYAQQIGQATQQTESLRQYYQNQLNADLSDLFAAQEGLDADLNNIQELAKSTDEEYKAVTFPAVFAFFTALLERLNASKFNPDAFADVAKTVQEDGLDAQDIEDVNDMMNGSMGDRIKAMWRNTQLRNIYISVIVMIGMTLSYGWVRLGFFIYAYSAGKSRNAWPCSSRAVYEADERITKYLLKQQRTLGSDAIRSASDIERRPLM
jgi:hypothetical protein